MIGTVTLLLVAATFLAIGWVGLTMPAMLLEPLGIELRSATAMNEARANYGGMHFAMGLLFLAGALSGKVRGIALTVALVFLSGLVVGRGVSVALDGFPEELTPWILLGAEILGLMLLMGALLKRRRVMKALTRAKAEPAAETAAPAA